MKELIEKKNDLITRAEEVINTAKTEKRELTEAEAAEIAEIRDNVRRIVRHLELVDDIDELDRMGRKEEGEQVMEKETTKEVEETRAIEIQEREAFENFIRGYVVHERAGELTPTPYNPSSPTAGAGGALIPTTIVNYIIKKVYDICPILERSQKFNVKGNLEVPFYPADSNKINVAYQSEFSPLTSSSGSFDTVTLTGFLAGCLTKISRSLINNVNFDIVGFVVDEMAYQISRWIEGELLNGTQNKVSGLSTLTNGITAASQTAITADEVVKLHDSIKDMFQNNAIWIMSPSTRTALRLLKSNTGYYLLNDDISTPFGTSLLGKPVYVSDNMPNIAAGNRVIYYGDMRGLATKFNENINIEVLRERYADEHAYGVIGWLEFDSKVIDEQQLAVMKMASA
jgi:HK97 family phage major capsid protein